MKEYYAADNAKGDCSPPMRYESGTRQALKVGGSSSVAEAVYSMGGSIESCLSQAEGIISRLTCSGGPAKNEGCGVKSDGLLADANYHAANAVKLHEMLIKLGHLVG